MFRPASLAPLGTALLTCQSAEKWKESRSKLRLSLAERAAIGWPSTATFEKSCALMRALLWKSPSNATKIRASQLSRLPSFSLFAIPLKPKLYFVR